MDKKKKKKKSSESQKHRESFLSREPHTIAAAS